MKKKNAEKSQRTPSSVKSAGPYLLDRLIVPRIESFAQNNDYTDIEAVADYLRGVYREYQRHKLGPFRSQVAKAVQFIQQRGTAGKQEIQLQVLQIVPIPSTAVHKQHPVQSQAVKQSRCLTTA